LTCTPPEHPARRRRRTRRPGAPDRLRRHRPHRDDLLAGRAGRPRPDRQVRGPPRQNGAISEQLGETTGTSFTVHNLTPGTRYTVNVLARDTAGNLSWSSPPLTFTTGRPGDQHLHGAPRRHQRLGQRLRRQPSTSPTPARPDQRLDADVHLADHVAER
jgi:hypothetical protein